jgi:hypothetical protein
MIIAALIGGVFLLVTTIVQDRTDSVESSKDKTSLEEKTTEKKESVLQNSTDVGSPRTDAHTSDSDIPLPKQPAQSRNNTTPPEPTVPTAGGETMATVEYLGDNVVLSFLKGAAIGIIVPVALLLCICAFFVDVVLVLFGKTFPTLAFLWGFAWDHLLITWFWSNASILGVILGGVGIFTFAFSLLSLLTDGFDDVLRVRHLVPIGIVLAVLVGLSGIGMLGEGAQDFFGHFLRYLENN